VRVLQIIDSLDVGGAEKMAVQIANSLSTKIEFSALCCTRNTGPLRKEINQKVEFIHLKKKHPLDLRALFRLRRFVSEHEIKIIHAHATSYFTASLLKLTLPRLKIVWHDHYGPERKGVKSISDVVLICCSLLFNYIIVVKDELKTWGATHLKCKNSVVAKNFISLTETEKISKSILFRGDKNSIKIIHVANFRPQKDHLTALKAIKNVLEDKIQISYHLFGSYDEDSSYYKNVLEFIQQNHLENHVFIYGVKENITDYLKNADIGILTSTSEGLPLSLIEYIIAKLPTVVTQVGQCGELVENYGKLFKPKDYKALSMHIHDIILNKELAKKNATLLYDKVYKQYSEDTVINQIIDLYRVL
jgi:glycosyltransferase involved in cell wall biosynthesis